MRTSPSVVISSTLPGIAKHMATPLYRRGDVPRCDLNHLSATRRLRFVLGDTGSYHLLQQACRKRFVLTKLQCSFGCAVVSKLILHLVDKRSLHWEEAAVAFE